MLLISLLLNPPAGLLVFFVMSVYTIVGAGINPGVYLRVLLVPVAFMLLGIFTVLISVSLDGGTVVVGLAKGGTGQAWLILNRSFGACSAMLFLALSTPAAEWIALANHPALKELGELAHLVYRMIFSVIRTAKSIKTAQEARNGYRTRGLGVRSMGQLAGRLLVRSLDRARGMEVGLAVRGYSGEARMLARHERFSWGAVSFFLITELMVVIISAGLSGGWHV